ncbi:MAG: hypothetical protein ACI8R4_001013 [Paracoccaceae bacterium]|jgi:hypothetical protein
MPIRFAINPALDLTRALLLGLVLCCLPGIGRAQATAETHELTLNQVRDLAVQALQSGDPGLAIQLSKGLLKVNSRDPFAYYVIAQAHASLNQPNLSRRAAVRAYRYSEDSPSQFQAAQLAARMAYAEGRPTLAQIWLRRTAIHAPTEREEKLVALDYRALRAQNPWAFRLRTDLRPSNNVNNGSDTALNIIDGVPDGGTLTATAQALPGLIGSVDISSTYRLRASQTSATSLGGRLYVSRVALSSASRAKAPLAHNSDFSSTYGELSLRHGFVAGPPGKGGTAEIDLAVGESWYAGERSYRFARLGAKRTWQLDKDRTRVRLNAMAEGRAKVRYASNDAKVFGLGGEVGRKLDNGDSVAVSLALRDSDAKHVNGTFKSASMRTSYTFGKAIGPARISTGLVLGYSTYPTYQIYSFTSNTIVKVPGGRWDKSAYADLSLFFDKYDYAGFAPMLRLRTGRKTSNISRFSTRDLSVSLSVESKF